MWAVVYVELAAHGGGRSVYVCESSGGAQACSSAAAVAVMVLSSVIAASLHLAAVIDSRVYILPDPLLLIAGAALLVRLWIVRGWEGSGGVIVALCVGLAAAGWLAARRALPLGLGDVKLLALGVLCALSSPAWLPVAAVVGAVFVALEVGESWVRARRHGIRGGPSDPFPFGPALVCAVLAGEYAAAVSIV